MEYFDEQALGNKSTEQLIEQLDFYQGVVNDFTLIEECRNHYSKVMEELLNYYYDRYEADYNAKMGKQGEEELVNDLPF